MRRRTPWRRPHAALIGLVLAAFLLRARPGGWRDHAVAQFYRHTPVWLWHTSVGIDRWMRYR